MSANESPQTDIPEMAAQGNAGAPEPVESDMAAIPAGWLLMGCATGRDDEKPVHRVWVDAFQIAALPGDARRVCAISLRPRTG